MFRPGKRIFAANSSRSTPEVQPLWHAVTRREFLVAGGLACFSGCSSRSALRSGPRAARAGTREDIYHRAELRFASANLFKPRENPEEGLHRTLAPLFLYESEDPDNPAWAACARPGPIFPGLQTNVTTPDGPVVHAAFDEVFLSGQARPRVNFLWLQPQPSETGQRAYTTQGIRIVLNSAGKPAITEVLRDSSQARILFVNASLEAAAGAAQGPALPGRRFAVERSLEEAPDTVVARVLEDGPVPMGPILYVKAGTADLATVICRCMPSQVQGVGRSEDYDLVLLDPARSSDTRAFDSMTRGLASTPIDELERRLRLPPTF